MMFRPTILAIVITSALGLFGAPRTASAQEVREFDVTSSGGTRTVLDIQEIKGNRTVIYGINEDATGDGIPIGPFEVFSSFVQTIYPSGAADVYSEVTLTSTVDPADSVTLYITQSRKPNESCFTGEFVILGGTGAYEGAWGYGESVACPIENFAERTGFIVY